MLSKDQLTFIGILKDFVFTQSTDKKEIDWDCFSSWAQMHNVEGIVYYQCKNFCPVSELRTKYLISIANYVKRKHAINLLEAALKGIPYIFVKGEVIAELYPIPALRSMGDVDVLIHDTDNAAVHDLLSDAGFLCTNYQNSSENTYSKNGQEFEIHSELIHLESGKANYFEYFKNVWCWVNDGRLDDNYHFVFVIMHMRYHFLARGIGFRFFIDVALIIQKQNLNWSLIENELTTLHLLNFCRIIMALIERWFGITPPIKNCFISDIDYEEATQKVFNDGLFGFHGDANEYNPVLSTMANKKYPYLLAKVFYCFRLVFPEYQVLRCMDGYAYLKGRKYLLPITWIHRLFRLLCTGKKKVTFGGKNINRKDTNKRNSIIEKWGLK